MPTNNPRMILTLKPDLMDSVKEFAESQGKRPATAVRDLLIEFQPMLDRASIAYRESKSNEDKAKMILNKAVMEG